MFFSATRHKRGEKMTTETVLHEPKLRLNKTVDVPTCGHCGSKNVYGITRVVGYFSRINNWNGSKQAELKDRRKGDYKRVF